MTDQKRKCITVTAKGRRCRNDAQEGSEYCHLPSHQGVKSTVKPLGRYYYFRFNPDSLIEGIHEDNPDLSTDELVELADEARMEWLDEMMNEITGRKWELVDDGTLDTCTRLYVPTRSGRSAGHQQLLNEEHEQLLEHCSNFDVVWPNRYPMNWAEETVYAAFMQTA